MVKNISKILSIVTVVKNDEKNIKKTIESIISQKNSLTEYIVICGKSNDNTYNILKRYKNKIDHIVVSKDKGIYDAMNIGVKKSKGMYLGFCNSGDKINKKSLKPIIKILSKKRYDILFATVKRHYLGSTIVKSGFNKEKLKYNFDFATSHSTGFYYKRSFHNKIGLYNLKYSCSADYDFYLRLFKLKNLKIMSTSKRKIFGEIASGGFSSKLTYLQHLNEETNIRMHNNQSLYLIAFIYLYSIIINPIKVLKSLIN